MRLRSRRGPRRRARRRRRRSHLWPSVRHRRPVLRAFRGPGTIARQPSTDIHAQLRPSQRRPHERRGAPSALRPLRDEVDVRKRRLQVMHYNDLLTQPRGAPKPDSPARQRMQDRWRVVLVDEFQDTDRFSGRCSTGPSPAMPWPWSSSATQAGHLCLPGWRRRDLPACSSNGRDGPDARDEPSLRTSPSSGAGCLFGGAELATLGSLSIPSTQPITAHGWPVCRPAARSACARSCLEDHLGGRPPLAASGTSSPMTWRATSPTCSPHPATFEGRPLRARDIAVLAHRGEDPSMPSVRSPGSGSRRSAAVARVLTSAAAHDWLALPRPWLRPTAACSPGELRSPICWATAPPSWTAGEEFDDLRARCRDLAGTYSRVRALRPCSRC